ncbi:hypothetical protein FB451DRAFT_184479 [Mycena latifolia]|nr:hypothetical protein FB451DRAFT_184479 [Mycena latifolia]
MSLTLLLSALLLCSRAHARLCRDAGTAVWSTRSRMYRRRSGRGKQGARCRWVLRAMRGHSSASCFVSLAGLKFIQARTPPPAHSMGRRCVRLLTPSFPVLRLASAAPKPSMCVTTSGRIRRAALCTTRPRGAGVAPPDSSSRSLPVHPTTRNLPSSYDILTASPKFPINVVYCSVCLLGL